GGCLVVKECDGGLLRRDDACCPRHQSPQLRDQSDRCVDLGRHRDAGQLRKTLLRPVLGCCTDIEANSRCPLSGRKTDISQQRRGLSRAIASYWEAFILMECLLGSMSGSREFRIVCMAV